MSDSEKSLFLPLDDSVKPIANVLKAKLLSQDFKVVVLVASPCSDRSLSSLNPIKQIWSKLKGMDYVLSVVPGVYISEAAQYALGEQAIYALLPARLGETCNPVPDSFQDVVKALNEIGHAILSKTPQDIPEFAEELSQLAVDCESGVGIELSAHHPFQKDASVLFQSWEKAFNEIQEADENDPPEALDVVLIDDDLSASIEKRLLPGWFQGAYKNKVEFELTGPDKLDDFFNGLAKVDMDSARQRPDVIVLDLDLRKWEENEPTKRAEKLLDLLERFRAEVRIPDAVLIELLHSYYRAKDKYLEADRTPGSDSVKKKSVCEAAKKRAIDHLKEQYCGVGCAEDSEQGVPDRRKHNEGIILYHYLRAIDETLPVIILTGMSEDRFKLRHSSGPNTVLLSKQEVLENPLCLWKSIQGLRTSTDKANTRESWARFRELAQELKKKADAVSFEPWEDNLVEDSETRVFALLQARINGKDQKYFARNFEASGVTGSLCAERSAIASCIAKNWEMGKHRPRKQKPGRSKRTALEHLKMLVILGDNNNQKRANPCQACGVCSEWISKCDELKVVMFSSCREYFCFRRKG
ncbi:MAG: hypothetical protein PF795_00850 [Kiritimatiellae bacterium]|nr:hypothetical protein [Kiritimatiellia bacterium]